MEEMKALHNEELQTKLKKLTDDGATLDELRAFAAEHGVAVGDENMQNGALPDVALEKVSGGDFVIDKEATHYDLVKRYYFQKGAQLAFILFIYYTPSPIGYDVIQIIEDEIHHGNLGYTYNGVYYSSPYDDPEYDDTWCF